jgi:mRNA-degrading endonuclease RelE of RelBE toxin-antitoxin system
MKVGIHREVQKYLVKLSVKAPKDKERCVKALKKLGEDPRHSRLGIDISKWSGPEFDYRLRVGRHRFGYIVKSEVVRVDDAWFK